MGHVVSGQVLPQIFSGHLSHGFWGMWGNLPRASLCVYGGRRRGQWPVRVVSVAAFRRTSRVLWRTGLLCDRRWDGPGRGRG